jgi:hypothetical protein
MNININIKPIYIATAILLITIGVCTKIIVNNSNSNSAEQIAIISSNNLQTQQKLDKVDGDLTEQNQKLDHILSKIDSLVVELGIIKEDLTVLSQKVDDNQEKLLIEIEGIKSTVTALRKAGYSSVTATKLINYNKCITVAEKPTAYCAEILN